MKSLINSENFLVFDLSKLGTAYQIINSFVDSETLHVFEISPIGAQAVLILMSKDLVLLQLVHGQSLSLYKTEILNSVIIEKVDSKILNPYLSQPSLPNTEVKSNLLVLETNGFGAAFTKAKQLVDSGLDIIDFRAIRTCPPNLIITATSDSIEKLSMFVNQDTTSKVSIIPKVQKSLRSYFEILS